MKRNSTNDDCSDGLYQRRKRADKGKSLVSAAISEPPKKYSPR